MSTIQHEARLLFLREFTKQLILNSSPKELHKELEIKLSEIPKLEQTEEKSMQIPEQLPQKTDKIKAEKPAEMIPSIVPQLATSRLVPKAPQSRKSFLPLPLSRTTQKSQPRPTSTRISPEVHPIPEKAEKLDLGKLNILIRDSRITTIECPGPDKFLVVRSGGRISPTKIKLSKKEIQNILKTFSEKAKIPLIKGVFKAAVGNLIISSVISELVGSRFIITKITPLTMLEQRARRHYR